LYFDGFTTTPGPNAEQLRDEIIQKAKADPDLLRNKKASPLLRKRRKNVRVVKVRAWSISFWMRILDGNN
jgi:hypothetical protein